MNRTAPEPTRTVSFANRARPPRNRCAVPALALLVALAACGKKAPPPPAPAPEAAQALAAIVATAAAVSGDVQVRRPGQLAWELVAPGSVFRVDDEVKTGPLSTVRIEFLAGGGLEMEQEAVIVIDVAPPAKPAAPGDAAAGESRVAVKEGVVRGFLPEAVAGAEGLGIVISTGDGSQVRIASTAGEKAATFRLSKQERGTELAVLQGTASVRGASGETALTAGHLALAAGGELGEVAELMDFPPSLEPGIDARFQLVPGLAIRLAWKEVPGVTGYRVQVARDLSFHDVELAKDVAGTEVTFVPRAAGMHVWRVASRDGNRRFGEYGFARRMYCEAEAPRDLLVGPADGTVLKYVDAPPEVLFSWESAGEARSYRVVLATGPDLLDHPVASTVVPGQRVAMSIDHPGDYWWGVYVDSGPDAHPIFARPRRLSVRKVAKPRVDVPRSISRWGD